MGIWAIYIHGQFGQNRENGRCGMNHLRDFDFSNLSAGERMELAQTLLDSIQSELYESAPSEEWKGEIRRRLAEIQSGTVQTIPWEEVKHSLKNDM